MTVAPLARLWEGFNRKHKRREAKKKRRRRIIVPGLSPLLQADGLDGDDCQVIRASACDVTYKENGQKGKEGGKRCTSRGLSGGETTQLVHGGLLGVVERLRVRDATLDDDVAAEEREAHAAVDGLLTLLEAALDELGEEVGG